MVQQIALTWTDVGVGQWLVDFQRFYLNPLPILIIESFLGNLTDVDLWVEVRGEGMMVITSVAVYDVQIVDFVEMVLGSISCINTRYTRIETTSKDGCQSCLLKAVLISPLPAVLKVCLVLWLVVGCVEIVTATSQTSIHNRQVLIG